MVKETFKSVLQQEIATLSKKYGIPEMPEVCRHALEVEYEEPVEYYLDMDELDTCALTIPPDYAIKHWDEISKVAAGLANVKGITSIDDFCKKEWAVDGEAREIEIRVEAAHWEKSQDELDAELYANAEAGDPDAIAELKRRDAAEHAERAKHWKEFILPIPAPSKTRPTELYLTMAYEPYDLIKSGEKVTEFREYCETWVKRILANMGTLRTVKFQRGYGGPGRPKPEQMIWTIKNIDLYDIETRESCDPMNVREGFVATHIAIDLGERCEISEKQPMDTNIKVIIGNIQDTPADAIVNAANSRHIGGGGIDGAIHKAAGPALAAACAELPRNSRGEWCPTGEARVTQAFNISTAKYIIHTAGPDCSREYVEEWHDSLLENCYRSVIVAAKENNCTSVAIPCISTGIFGFPIDRAAYIAVTTVKEMIADTPNLKVTFVIWGGDHNAAETKALYEKELTNANQVKCVPATGQGTQPSQKATPIVPTKLASFIANYKNALDTIAKNTDALRSHDDEYHPTLNGMAQSLGEVYGIKCVMPGKIGSSSNDEPAGEFELHTALGEFKISLCCFSELGLFTINLNDELSIRYTDIRLVVAMGLLNLCQWDNRCKTYRIGDARNGLFNVNTGLDGGSWIELRGMSEEWAWDIAHRMGFPSCLDRFEHFCRDFAWIDEEGKLITDQPTINDCNSTLLKINACCLQHYREDFWAQSDVVSHRLTNNALALNEIIKHAPCAGQNINAPICPQNNNVAFPKMLTATMVADFKADIGGSTCPHHGFIDGNEFVLKCGSYSSSSSDAHVHNEYVADCLLRAAGCLVPDSREYQVDIGHGKVETLRLSKFINARPIGAAYDEEDDAGKQKIREGIIATYPVLSFISAIDSYQHPNFEANVLVDEQNRLWFIDNGATFDYRARGGKKGWFFKKRDVLSDEEGYFSLLKHRSQDDLRRFLQGISDDELRRAAAKYCFRSLVESLPRDYQKANLLDYATRLDTWARE